VWRGVIVEKVVGRWPTEPKALRRYAVELLGYNANALNKAIVAGELIEVEDNG
jgi:hypothetical protein